MNFRRVKGIGSAARGCVVPRFPTFGFVGLTVEAAGLAVGAAGVAVEADEGCY